jgi:hypothetical protein
MGNALTVNPQLLSFTQRAEHELASFHRAVTELYGPQEAARAAEDWLRAFESSSSTTPAGVSWNRIAQSAASRLASRLGSRRKLAPFQRMRQFVRNRANHSPCFSCCGAK